VTVWAWIETVNEEFRSLTTLGHAPGADNSWTAGAAA